MANLVNAQYLVDRLMQGGLSRAQASALVGNFQRESSLNPQAYNPKENAFGLMQWRGDRLASLQRYANDQGKSWTDPTVQADFALHEMNTTEAGNAKNFLAATDVNEANKALHPVIRYANPAEAALRGSYGQQIYDGKDPYADVGGPQAAATTQAPAVSRETIQQPSRAQYNDPFNAYEAFKLDQQMTQKPKGLRGGLTALGYGLSEGAKPVIQKAGGLGTIFGMGGNPMPGNVQPGTPAGLSNFTGLFGKPAPGATALGSPAASTSPASVQPAAPFQDAGTSQQLPQQTTANLQLPQQTPTSLDDNALQPGAFGGLV